MATLRSRGDAPATAKGASLPYLRYPANVGTYTWVPVGFSAEQGIPVRYGTLIILDFLVFREGEVCLGEGLFDDSLMVPRGQKLPPRCGRPGYIDGLQIDVIVQGLGLCTFTSTADCVCKVIEAAYTSYCFAPEAQAGQMPVYRIEPSRKWLSKRHGSTNYDPVWDFTGWTPRSGHFRTPVTAVPKPITFELQAIESDAAFTNMAAAGEVIEAEHSVAASAPKSSKRKRLMSVPLPSSGSVQPDPDLDDEVSF
jgi:hypothetical protein